MQSSDNHAIIGEEWEKMYIGMDDGDNESVQSEMDPQYEDWEKANLGGDQEVYMEAIYPNNGDDAILCVSNFTKLKGHITHLKCLYFVRIRHLMILLRNLCKIRSIELIPQPVQRVTTWNKKIRLR